MWFLQFNNIQRRPEFKHLKIKTGSVSIADGAIRLALCKYETILQHITSALARNDDGFLVFFGFLHFMTLSCKITRLSTFVHCSCSITYLKYGDVIRKDLNIYLTMPPLSLESHHCHRILDLVKQILGWMYWCEPYLSFRHILQWM